MVELIIKQQKKHRKTIELLKSQFRNISYDDQDLLIMVTQEYVGCREHKYVIKGNDTVKVENDRLFIITDHVASVIDLNKEAPYCIYYKRGY